MSPLYDAMSPDIDDSSEDRISNATRAEIVEVLCKAKADANVVAFTGMPMPLQQAASGGLSEAVNVLITTGGAMVDHQDKVCP